MSQYFLKKMGEVRTVKKNLVAYRDLLSYIVGFDIKVVSSSVIQG